MPYYYQQKIAERYFTYNNIRHDGAKIENNKLYSALAPQVFGVVAKDISPYTNTGLILSGGFPLYSDENPQIKWSIVEMSNDYPDLNVINSSVTSTIIMDPNSRNNFSYPFSMVVKNTYFKYRYFLTHPASGARNFQPNPFGRWIYSKKPAFIEYQTNLNYFKYNFGKIYTNNHILSGLGIDIDTYKYNIVISDNNKNVIYKKLNISNTENFLKMSRLTPSLSSTFFSTNSTTNIILKPFDYDLFPKEVDPNTSFGKRVKISNKNILVSDPLSGNGRIYVYSINQYITGNEIHSEKVLTSNYNLSGFGRVIDYKEVKDRSSKIYKEVLVVSTKTQSNSSIEIYSNNFVDKIGGIPLNRLLNYSISGQRFRNVWSSRIINQSNLSGIGYYGYDIAIQVPDTTFNKTTNVLYVSEPFNDRGVIYIYGYQSSSNSWSYLTSLSSVSANNYGYSISVGGPYLNVSAPNSVVNNVTGALIDVYKFTTSDENGVSLSAGTPLFLGGISYGFYNINKTDTLFIPSTSNLGKHIDYNENNLNFNLLDRKYTNFYGNHLAIAGDNKTEIYCRYFDKFEKNSEIFSSDKNKIWKNVTYQISNSAVRLNAANVLW